MDEVYYQDLVKEYKETLAVAVESINELEQQNAELLDALKAVRSGRVAMKLWVNKNTKCGEESYAHKLSDSELRSFITEKAIAKAEGE